jgi:hypothetical protein
MAELQPLLDAALAAAAWLAKASAKLPPWAAMASVAAGLLLAVLGSRRPLSRLAALAGGVAVGFALAAYPASLLHFPLESVQYALAGGLGLVGLAFPSALAFEAAGTPAALLAARFFPADSGAALLMGFLGAGAVGAVLAPWLLAAITGFAGGLAFAAGLARTLPPASGGAWLLHHGWALAALGLGVGLAGTLAQLNLPDEEERLAAAAERGRLKEQKRADKARRGSAPKKGK